MNMIPRQQKMADCQHFRACMSSPSSLPGDPRLDFCSPLFDALAALYAPSVALPVPNIRPLDNIAAFAAKLVSSSLLLLLQ